jgi:hypothetical protein
MQITQEDPNVMEREQGTTCQNFSVIQEEMGVSHYKKSKKELEVAAVISNKIIERIQAHRRINAIQRKIKIG